jgi:hypothetical protein
MRKALLSIGAAAALATAVAAAPQPAHAVAWWVIPAIVGGAVVGVGVGAAAANSQYAMYNDRYAGPRGNVYVEPSCHIVRERLANGRIHRVRVCP